MSQSSDRGAARGTTALDTAAETLLLLALTLPLLWPFDPGPAPKMLSMLLAALLWAAALLPQAWRGRLASPGWGGATLLALAAVIAAQSVGGRLAYASQGWDAVAVLLGAAALAGLGRALAQRSDWVALVCGALLAQGLGQVLVGLLQFGMWQLPAPAQWLNAHAAWVYQIVSYPGDGRIYGNLRQPNHYASALALGLAGLAGLAPRLRARWVWTAALALSWALMASGSRAAALLALLIAGGVLLAAPKPWRSPQWRALLALPLLYLLWLLAQHAAQAHGWISGLDAISRTVEQPVNARGVIWRNAWQIFMLQPWTGWGWGQIGWGLERAAVAGQLHPLPLENVDNAHNLVLQLLSETGLVGVAVVLPFALAWCWRVSGPWRRRGDDAAHARLQLLAPLLAAASLLLHSLLEYPLWYLYFLFVLAFALGWAEGVVAPTTEPTRRARWTGTALAALALLLTLRAGLDYLDTANIYEGDAAAAPRLFAQDWFFGPLADFAGGEALLPEPGDDADALHAKLAQLERLSHAWGDPGLLERRMLVLLRLGRRDEAQALAAYCAHAFWLDAPQARKELGQLARRAGMRDDPDLARLQATLAAAPRLKRLSVERPAEP